MGRYLLMALAVWAATPMALAKEPYVMGFEEPDSPLNDKWTVSPLEGPNQNVRFSDERARSGRNSLKIYGLLPDGFGVTYYPWQDWQGYKWLSFDLWTPQSAAELGPSFDCWVYIKDRSYYWYQTPLFKDPKTLKRTVRLPRYGGWTHFDLDISASSTIWQPGGHKRSWDNATHNPREFGIRFFGQKKWEGVVYLDNVTLWGDDLVLGVRTAQAGGTRPLEVSASAQSVPVYEKLELTFPVDAQYTNPFDPEVVDVEGHFVSPSGVEMQVPGFWYQAYERTLTEDGFEQLIPVGKPCWKVRFAPTEAGMWRYYVTLSDARGTAQSAPMSLTATAPLQPRGYVRVSQKDPLYFEFQNGDWYWPIGINMRDGGDDASKQKGTYDFDYYFRRFEEEGLNFVRTWMCAWWGGIEWSDEYHSRFDGIGRYNQYNAWRLDYCVDLARKHNLYLEITLNSHGQVRRDKFDEEWSYSPWNTRNGGYVASPAQFFTSADVKRDFRNRYRYIVARWGYSRNIMAFDLWNEVDLVDGYDPNEVAAWHKEMAAYLKSIDPWKHLVFTHICLFWSFGTELWQLPEIECVQSDAYWDNKKDGRVDMGMLQSFQGKVNAARNNEPLFNKPFVFIEYGPQTAAIPRLSPADWRSRFRTGLWTSAVLPTAAQGIFWYPREWEKYKLYQYQKPVQKLFADYDRRGQYLRLREASINGAAELKAVGMANNREGFFYVHNPGQMGIEDRTQAKAAVTGATITVPNMTPGAWEVEYVDTLTGEVTGKTSATVEEGRWRLEAELPPVVDDLLLHVRRTGG